MFILKTGIKKNAPVDVTWRIEYRFYEPGFDGHRVRIKDFACYKDLRDRQSALSATLEFEKERLEKGYNPRIGKMVNNRPAGMGISVDSELAEGLQWALNRYTGKTIKTLRDMKSRIGEIIVAIPFLPYSMPVLKDILPYHIEDLLNKTKELNNAKKTDVLGRPRTNKMSDFTWNRYKRDLGTLMTMLMDNRIILYNPAHTIKNKLITKKRRQPIEQDDIIKIDQHLAKNHPGMWAFFHMFYHSGAHEIELTHLKVKDVNLVKQEFKVIIKKGGGNPEEFFHVINDDVLPIWQEHLKDADPEHYVFSQDFFTGNKFRNRKDPPPHVMRDDYITKQWEKRVKKPLDIKHTMYILKHMHTIAVIDKMAENNGREAAAMINGHKSTAMIDKVYDLTREDREKRRLKAISVPLIKIKTPAV